MIKILVEISSDNKPIIKKFVSKDKSHEQDAMDKLYKISNNMEDLVDIDDDDS